PRATATTGGVLASQVCCLPRARFCAWSGTRVLEVRRSRRGDFFRSGMVETPAEPGAPAARVVHRWTRPWSTARRERRKKRYLILDLKLLYYLDPCWSAATPLSLRSRVRRVSFTTGRKGKLWHVLQ